MIARNAPDKIPNIASFHPKLESTVSQLNKVRLPYIVCVFFCDLMGVLSPLIPRCRRRPQQKKKETRLAILMARRDRQPREFCPISAPASRLTCHPASGK